MNYRTLPQFQRKSLATNQNAQNTTDIQYNLLTVRRNPPAIIIDYWSLQQFHRQSQWTTKHAHNFTDN